MGPYPYSWTLDWRERRIMAWAGWLIHRFTVLLYEERLTWYCRSLALAFICNDHTCDWATTYITLCGTQHSLSVCAYNIINHPVAIIIIIDVSLGCLFAYYIHVFFKITHVCERKCSREVHFLKKNDDSRLVYVLAPSPDRVPCAVLYHPDATQNDDLQSHTNV